MYSYIIPKPSLEQLFYPLLSKLRQKADNDQLQDCISKVLIQVCISPDIKLSFYLFDPVLRLLATIESLKRGRRQQGE